MRDRARLAAKRRTLHFGRGELFITPDAIISGHSRHPIQIKILTQQPAGFLHIIRLRLERGMSSVRCIIVTFVVGRWVHSIELQDEPHETLSIYLYYILRGEVVYNRSLSWRSLSFRFPGGVVLVHRLVIIL